MRSRGIGEAIRPGAARDSGFRGGLPPGRLVGDRFGGGRIYRPEPGRAGHVVRVPHASQPTANRVAPLGPVSDGHTDSRAGRPSIHSSTAGPETPRRRWRKIRTDPPGRPTPLSTHPLLFPRALPRLPVVALNLKLSLSKCCPPVPAPPAANVRIGRLAPERPRIHRGKRGGRRGDAPSPFPWFGLMTGCQEQRGGLVFCLH